MTQKKKEQIANQLSGVLKNKFPDIVVKVDELGKGTIFDMYISCSWHFIGLDRGAVPIFMDTKVFKMMYSNYQKIIDTKILPFFSEQR